jgi:hypothetical protein
MVFQNEAVIAAGDSDRPVLATTGIATCVGVGVCNPAGLGGRGVAGLAHADSNTTADSVMAFVNKVAEGATPENPAVLHAVTRDFGGERLINQLRDLAAGDDRLSVGIMDVSFGDGADLAIDASTGAVTDQVPLRGVFLGEDAINRRGASQESYHDRPLVEVPDSYFPPRVGAAAGHGAGNP